MKALLVRLQENDKQTLSRFYLYDGEDQVYKAVALELPDRDNQTNISRIPAGDYTVKKRRSKKYSNHFHVMDVEGRKLILIHPGNFYYDTRGCILLGVKFLDINSDGEKDVYMSRPAVNELLSKAPKEFTLKVLEL